MRSAGPFRLVASVPKRTYRKGEAVEITFTVTNTSPNNLSLMFSLANGIDGFSAGGRLGQFTVAQGEKQVFNSKPDGGEPSDLIIRAGATVKETFKWRQVDYSSYLPLSSPYKEGTFAPNTAATGNYQIVPRFNVGVYARYVTTTHPNGSQSQGPEDYVSLEGGPTPSLPPLTVTIEP